MEGMRDWAVWKWASAAILSICSTHCACLVCSWHAFYRDSFNPPSSPPPTSHYGYETDELPLVCRRVKLIHTMRLETHQNPILYIVQSNTMHNVNTVLLVFSFHSSSSSSSSSSTLLARRLLPLPRCWAAMLLNLISMLLTFQPTFKNHP